MTENEREYVKLLEEIVAYIGAVAKKSEGKLFLTPPVPEHAFALMRLRIGDIDASPAFPLDRNNAEFCDLVKERFDYIKSRFDEMIEEGERQNLHPLFLAETGMKLANTENPPSK